METFQHQKRVTCQSIVVSRTLNHNCRTSAVILTPTSISSQRSCWTSTGTRPTRKMETWCDIVVCPVCKISGFWRGGAKWKTLASPRLLKHLKSARTWARLAEKWNKTKQDCWIETATLAVYDGRMTAVEQHWNTVDTTGKFFNVRVGELDQKNLNVGRCTQLGTRDYKTNKLLYGKYLVCIGAAQRIDSANTRQSGWLYSFVLCWVNTNTSLQHDWCTVYPERLVALHCYFCFDLVVILAADFVLGPIIWN